MAEDGITARFVANFQQLLTAHQLLIESDIDFCVKVLHQAHAFNCETKKDKKHSGYIDLTILYDFEDKQIKLNVVKDIPSVFPMVFMEFTQHATKSVDMKLPQSSLYANYLFRQMNEDLPIGLPPLLGITFSERCYVAILYYLTENKESGKMEIAEIRLREGVFDEAFIHILVGLVWEFITSIKNLLTKFICSTEVGCVLNSAINVLFPNRNVLLHEEYVYKSFDYRNRATTALTERRDYNMYKYARFPMDIVVSHEPTDQSSSSLHIIRYRYIEGSSSPSHIIHFYDIVCELCKLHEQNIAFGDVRLANMVFKPLTTDALKVVSVLISQRDEANYSSCLIDFDYARVAGQGVYPPRYNINVPDGPRHHEARSYNPVETIHDCYSLGTIMGYFCFVDPDPVHASAWATIATLVVAGNLADAIEEFDKLPNYPLKCIE